MLFRSFLIFSILSLCFSKLNLKMDLSLSFCLYSIFAAPIIEEYVFRFLPYNLLNIKNKKIQLFIMIMCSFLFSISHKSTFQFSIIIFITGILFTLVYYFTKNILYSIICHSFYNLFVVIKYYFDADYILFLLIFGIYFVFYFIFKRLKKVK